MHLIPLPYSSHLQSPALDLQLILSIWGMRRGSLTGCPSPFIAVGAGRRSHPHRLFCSYRLPTPPGYHRLLSGRTPLSPVGSDSRRSATDYGEYKSIIRRMMSLNQAERSPSRRLLMARRRHVWELPDAELTAVSARARRWLRRGVLRECVWRVNDRAYI